MSIDVARFEVYASALHRNMAGRFNRSSAEHHGRTGDARCRPISAVSEGISARPIPIRNISECSVCVQGQRAFSRRMGSVEGDTKNVHVVGDYTLARVRNRQGLARND